jgi:hypothetical protein
MLSRKGRFLHQETNTIGFAFLSFFFDFLWIFEVAVETLIHNYTGTLDLNFQNYA